MRRISLIVALAVITSGCLTLTPVQRDAVVDVQRFADATTTAYKLPSIRLTIEPATNLGIGGRYRQGNFYLNETQLNSGSLTALVAHELAHYVLGHDAPLTGAASMSEYLRMQEQRELDANAKAVEILVRTQGLSERQALMTMVVKLRAV
ncbi:MAG TPA: ImmA/IrrE family metallo-endopeptidase, partial [Patescibacteria group bacterium]|nr:ImmA/IrrE family metallo-endopeptidase [Patescibacteria group bacterium]